jgi:succinyl-CoA synthetase beta subunit
VRGRKPVDLAELEKLMVRFSQLVVEQPWIAELDINPLIASPDGLLALDGRVLLHDLNLSEDQLPKLAIRPYPNKYVGKWSDERWPRSQHPPHPRRGRAADAQIPRSRFLTAPFTCAISRRWF